jgi:hypothetical protein
MAPAPLSPFVGALAAALREALWSLVATGDARPAGFTLDVRAAPAPGWNASLTLALPAGEVTLDVADASTPRDAWFRTAHFAWAYRAVGGRDPFAHPASSQWLKAFRERVTQLDRSPLAPPVVRAVLDAASRYLPFARVRDEDFRLLMEGSEGPTGILWLGFGCDQDCVICWQSRTAPEPPPERFSRWLDEMLAAGVRSVILSGGEPTRHPLLLDLVRRAHAAGVHTVVETNGLRLADDDFRRALREAGVDELSVSLHAPDAETSEAITRAPGTHARTVAGVEACLRDGLSVGLHCVVERRNAPALAAHAAFAVERFARAGRPLRRVSYSLPTRYADAERYRRGLAPVDEVRPGLTAALKTLRGAGVEARFLGMGGFPLCAVDDPRAERPSAMLGAGERGDRVYGRPCEACAVRPWCGGVPAEYLEACGDGGLRPARESSMAGVRGGSAG